jgi:hypothetical protein
MTTRLIVALAMATIWSVDAACGDRDHDVSVIPAPLSDETMANHRIDYAIPLRKVWALDMPGTRQMSRTQRGDPPSYESSEGGLVAEIVRALNYPNRLNPKLREKFMSFGTGSLVIAGRDMEALRGAHAVLVEGEEPRTFFRQDELLSVLFFTLPTGDFVHLSKAEQSGETVRIFYRLVPHKSKQTSVHVALVPITNPGSGHVQIKIKQLVDGSSFLNYFVSVAQELTHVDHASGS